MCTVVCMLKGLHACAAACVWQLQAFACACVVGVVVCGVEVLFTDLLGGNSVIWFVRAAALSMYRRRKGPQSPDKDQGLSRGLCSAFAPSLLLLCVLHEPYMQPSIPHPP